MFAPTTQMLRLLAVAVRTQPFGGDELRRIVGMGETYVCLASHAVAPDYTETMTFAVDGTTYRLLFRRTPEA